MTLLLGEGHIPDAMSAIQAASFKAGFLALLWAGHVVISA